MSKKLHQRLAETLARDPRYLMPWVLLPAPLLAAGIAHAAWADSPAHLAFGALGMGAAATGVTALTWRTSKARDAITRALSAASMGAAGAWTTLATVAGPCTRPLLDVLVVGGAGLCVAHTARRALRGHGGDGDNKWGEFAEKIRLPKSRVVRASVDGPRFEATVQLDPGRQTQADAQAAAPHLASALGVPATVRIVPDAEDGGRVSVHGVTTDVLKTSTPWPGPSAPGDSLAVPAQVGVYEDGQPVSVWLAGDPASGRAPSHLIIAGMTRAGKTQGAQLLMGELLTRRDVVVWLGDSSKGAQTAGPLLSGLDWYACEPSAIKTMIASAYQVAKARSQWLGQRGFTEWVPECGIPALVVWIEEAHEHISDSPKFDALAKQALSAGVFLIASTQRASYMSMSTEARAQFGTAWCFGVQDDADAGFVLPDVVLDTGVSPARWRNGHPGKSLLATPGVDEQRWSMPLRTYALDREQLQQTVEQTAGIRAGLDELSARIAGPAYTNRNHTRPQATVAGAGGHDERLDEVPALPDDPGVPTDVDPTCELEAPQPPGLVFSPPAQPVRQLSTEQATAALREHLRKLAENNEREIGPAGLVQFRQQIGRSRTWVSRQLAALVDEGVVFETGRPGVYALGELVAA